MKTRSFCAVVCAGLVAAPTVHSGPVNFDPGGGAPDARTPLLAPARGDCGSDTLTQSTNPNVIGAATIICGDAEVSAEFSLARVFTAPYTMSVECVTFGVRLNDGPEWPARVRILSGPINAPYDSLTLLAESVAVVPADSSFEFHTVAMPDHVIAAGSEFIVELRSDSRLPGDGGDDGLLGFGCNVQGQSAPTYYRGPACAQPDFINLADIGFAGRHLVMTLGVSEVEEPVLVGGFLHAPLGGATLTQVDDDFVVSGDPGGGPMGASIILGELTSGGGAGAMEWPHQPASSMSFSFKGRLTDTITLAYSSENSIFLETDFDSTAFDLFEVAVFLDGELVGILEGETSGTVEIFAPPTPSPTERLITNWGISYIWCFPVNYGTKFERTGYYIEFSNNATFVGAGAKLAGNAIEIRPGGVGSQPTSGPIAVDITSIGLAEFQLLTSVNSASVLFGATPTQPRCEIDQVVTVNGLQAFKHPHRNRFSQDIVLSAGDFTANATADLLVSGIGAIEEPIGLNFGGVESANVDIEIMNPGPTGACLTLRAVQVGGDDGGTVAFDPCVGCPPPFKGQWNVVGNFSGVGSGTYTLQLALDGQVVLEQVGMTGLAGVSVGAPSKGGKLGGATPCWRLCWPTDTLFLHNGQSFLIDEVRLLAEGGATLNPLDLIEVSAANIEALLLSNPTTVLPDIAVPCPGDTNGDNVIDFADLNTLLSSFNTSPPNPGYNPGADFDNDGDVDFSDLNVLLSAFNTNC